MYKESQIKRLEEATGISWHKWLELFEPHKDNDHTRLAESASAFLKEHSETTSPEWWAQSATVLYEQYIGRRVPGQRCDDSFSVSISKTIAGRMDEVIELWTNWTQDDERFEDIRVSSSEKWRYWKANLTDGSKLNVNIQTKPDGKRSSLTINHDNLNSTEDIALWRQHWKDFLNNRLEKNHGK